MKHETVTRPGEGWKSIAVGEDLGMYYLTIYGDGDVLPLASAKMTKKQATKLRDNLSKVLDEAREE